MTARDVSTARGSWFQELYKKYYPYEMFLILFTVVVSITLLHFLADGLFVTDEAVYFLSVQSVAERSSFEIWNGLNEISHESLRFSNLTTVAQGRLYGQYPPLYPLMAYPFYRLFGIHGLFLLNLFSFAASMILVYVIVVRVFADRLLAAASVVAYSLCTYAVEFGLDLWPHMFSVALVLASFYLVIRRPERSLGCAIAGFFSAVAVGVRYQDVIFTGVLLLYVLFSYGAKRSVSFLAGAFVPFSVIAVINYSLFSSLSTGYSEMGVFFGGYGYFYLALFAALFFAAYVLYSLTPSAAERERLIVYALLAFTLMPVVFWLADSQWVEKVKTSLQVLYSEVVDIGAFPDVSVGYGKKSLLQAAPFLVLAVFSLHRVFKFKERRNSGILFVVFAFVEVVFFSSVVGQHGEYTSSMRFFLESVPFLAALSVYTINDVLANIRRDETLVYSLLFIASVFVFIAGSGDSLGFPLYRTFPLVMVVYALVAYFLQARVRRIRVFFVSFVVVLFSYSLVISISELAVSFESRKVEREIAADVCENVRGDSLVLYSKNIQIIFLAPARLCGNVRFGLVDAGNPYGVMPLVDFYHARGTSVYLIDDGTLVEWSLFAERLRSLYNSTITLTPYITYTRIL